MPVGSDYFGQRAPERFAAQRRRDGLSNDYFRSCGGAASGAPAHHRPQRRPATALEPLAEHLQLAGSYMRTFRSSSTRSKRRRRRTVRCRRAQRGCVGECVLKTASCCRYGAWDCARPEAHTPALPHLLQGPGWAGARWGVDRADRAARHHQATVSAIANCCGTQRTTAAGCCSPSRAPDSAARPARRDVSGNPLLLGVLPASFAGMEHM